MAIREQCGNDYDKCFQIVMGGITFTFDCFECAIGALAPICNHCGNRVIGHGVEHQAVIYCSAHCAKHEDVKTLIDRD